LDQRSGILESDDAGSGSQPRGVLAGKAGRQNPESGHPARGIAIPPVAKPRSGWEFATDSHLAALAIEFDAIVHTADTDFLRLEGVKWVNPLS
jgi:hypothetical protein